MFIATSSIIKIIYSMLLWMAISPSLQCFFLPGLSNLFKIQNPQPISIKVPEEKAAELEKMIKNNPELVNNFISQYQNGNAFPTTRTTQNMNRNQMVSAISNSPSVSNVRRVRTSIGDLPSEIMVDNKKFVLTTRGAILQNKLVNLFKKGGSTIVSPFLPTINYSDMPVTISDEPRKTVNDLKYVDKVEVEEDEEEDESEEEAYEEEDNDIKKPKIAKSQKSEIIQNKRKNIENNEKDRKNHGKPAKIEDDYEEVDDDELDDDDDDNENYFYE